MRGLIFLVMAVVLFGGGFCFGDVQSGLVGLWRFEQSLTDSAGVHDGTGHGGVGFVEGYLYDGLSFDGGDDYVQVPSTSALRPASDFTIAAWVKLSSLDNTMFIVSHDDNGGADDGYLLGITGNGNAIFAAMNANIAGQAVTSSQKLTIGEWHHVAGSYDGAAVRVYVDGYETSEAAAGGAVRYESMANVNIGMRSGGGYYLNGVIDELRFYSRVLSNPEINELKGLGDNCSGVHNPDQSDRDGDGVGDVCDPWPDDRDDDIDGDEISGHIDNCPLTPNHNQADQDGDGIGDSCDVWPDDAENDIDGDGWDADNDNCPYKYNRDQVDSDVDGIGDVCDGLLYVDDDEPAPYRKIQDAIDAAAEGETVIVMPGVYIETITLPDYPIILRSLDPEDESIVASTIIDGGQAGSVITCDLGVGPDTVISGLSITNGRSEFGGGMYNNQSSPTVMYCVFSGNSATNGINGADDDGTSGGDFTGDDGTAGGYGGGIYNSYSSPKIINCTFSGNRAGDGGNGGGGDFGGNGAPGGNGGGIYNSNSSPEIIGCTFNANRAGSGGNGGNSKYFGGSSSAGGHGGGVYNTHSNPVISGCVFIGNGAGTGGDGGGSAQSLGSGLRRSGGSGGEGGAIFNADSATIVSNCSFRNNSSGEGGLGGPSYQDENRGDRGWAGRGGAIGILSGELSVSGSVFCNNQPGNIWGAFKGSYLGTPDCEIIKGDLTGDGDVDMADLAVLGENWLEGTD